MRVAGKGTMLSVSGVPDCAVPAWNGRANGQHVQLSVVVPCRNEVENLKQLHRRLTDACRSVAERYEIVLVNDGSRDDTWIGMKQLADCDSHVVAVDLSRNHGHQLALSAGLSLARGERILIIDADLQDPPELLPEMMRYMDAGADVVYGQRLVRQGETRSKRLGAFLFYRLLASMSDVPIPSDTGDFRLLGRRVLDVLLAMPEQNRFIRGMVSWAGFRQVAIPYERAPREKGTTKYTTWKMLDFALDAITGFSAFPLRLSIAFSLIFFLASGLVLVYALFSFFFLKVVSGWTSITMLITLFSAVQLFCIGIIGEYVGRIFIETKRRPLFVIREVKCSPADSNADAGVACEGSRSAL
jgi:glycosyltransferase involved in cell wall biosynthesis